MRLPIKALRRRRQTSLDGEHLSIPTPQFIDVAGVADDIKPQSSIDKIRILGTRWVSKLLGVSPSTVRRWMHRGVIPDRQDQIKINRSFGSYYSHHSQTLAELLIIASLTDQELTITIKGVLGPTTGSDSDSVRRREISYPLSPEWCGVLGAAAKSSNERFVRTLQLTTHLFWFQALNSYSKNDWSHEDPDSILFERIDKIMIRKKPVLL